MSRGAGGSTTRGGGASIGDSLGGYGPGTVPDTLRPGQAILVKAGSDLVLQLHYTANGKEADDTSKVGLIFAKEKPTARLAMLSATNFKIAIPPNDPNYQVSAKVTLQRDATLMSLLPHMHLRGKDMQMTATFPDGRTETLLSVSVAAHENCFVVLSSAGGPHDAQIAYRYLPWHDQTFGPYVDVYAR